MIVLKCCFYKQFCLEANFIFWEGKTKITTFNYPNLTKNQVQKPDTHTFLNIQLFKLTKNNKQKIKYFMHKQQL